MFVPFAIIHEYTLNTQKVQHVVPEITIPPEVTAAEVTMYIVDTGCMSIASTRLIGID